MTPIRWSRRKRVLASLGDDLGVISVVGPAFLAASRYETASARTRTLFGLLHASDLAIATLPACLMDGAIPTALTARVLSSAVADDLLIAGIRAVNLATAHVYDAGPDGIRQTLLALRRRGIAAVGAGDSAELTKRPWLHVAAVTRIAVLGFRCAEHWPEPRSPTSSSQALPAVCAIRVHWVRTQGQQCCPEILPNAGDLRDMLALIGATKYRGTLTLVMLDMEWPEVWSPEQSIPVWIRKLSQGAIEAGADLVFVSGYPQILAAERFKHGFVLYGIGHFFQEDLPHAPSIAAAVLRPEVRNAELRESLLVRVITSRGRLQGLEFVPYRLSAQGSPEVTDDAQASRTLESFSAQSTKLGVTPARDVWMAQVTAG